MERGIHILITLCSVLAGGRCGDVQVVGSSAPLLAVVGSDVTLPCSLNPPKSAVNMTVEWTRFDLTDDGTHVHAYVDRHENHVNKNPSYKYRTMLFEDDLEKGIVSLKLSNVRLSDEGNYKCFFLSLDSQVKEVIIQLKVVAVSQPVISILGLRDGYVDLQCEVTTRYQDPQMKWLDRHGDARSGNVSYSTDNYTVRSTVTVKETDTEWITCEVELETKKAKSDPVSAASDNGGVNTSLVVLGGLCVAMTLIIIVLSVFIVQLRSTWTSLSERRPIT